MTYPAVRRKNESDPDYRFDLAAQAYRDLGEGYANTHYDAWASAARIYDRQLNDPVLARALDLLKGLAVVRHSPS